MATDADGGAEEAVGMPQLDFSTFENQLFWLLVTIVVLYLIISRVALPRIGAVIEERHDAIANDLERAAEFRRRAEEAERSYEKALADARAEAQRIAAENRAAIQREVEKAQAEADAQIGERLQESEARIEEIRQNAAEAVDEVARDVAAEIVGAILPSQADNSAIAAAVSARTGG
ncbi:MAG: F0F1 ATP synthase subunit B' [Pseudomonadota bacterium]